MTDQLRPDDTREWLRMLFRPGDTFEVRVKHPKERGAAQMYLSYAKLEPFVQTHIPIHTENRAHVWVGVAPRPRVGDSSPVLHRALWVDFDATVTSVDQAKEAIRDSGIPDPTMLVWSGNGVHGYWALKEPATPEDVRPHARGLHAALPTDNTHDSARIMRVPGTLNPKDPDHPTPSYIAEHHPERVYELAQFPRAESQAFTPAVPGRPAAIPLNDADRSAFIAAWIPGQRHQMTLAVAGFLRKNLHYTEDQALATILDIHRSAGFNDDLDTIRKDVRDTFAQLYAKVAGSTALHDLGIQVTHRDPFTLRIQEPPKRKIEIIDFNTQLEEQEFWADGLVGPGLLSLWAAEPKTGKSFAMMQLGYALSKGERIWDFDTVGSPLRVLYFQGELSKGMVYSRAKGMFGMAGIRDPRSFAMTAKPPEPIDLVRNPEVLTDLAEHYDLIIVDPIATFTSNDESKSHNVNEVISIFDQLRHQGKGIVLVHHLRKLDTNRDGTPVVPSFADIRGSSAWFATADAIALHYKTNDERITGVKFTYRAAPDRQPLQLYRMPHGGFTHDKTQFWAAYPTVRLNLGSAVN